MVMFRASPPASTRLDKNYGHAVARMSLEIIAGSIPYSVAIATADFLRGALIPRFQLSVSWSAWPDGYNAAICFGSGDAGHGALIVQL